MMASTIGRTISRVSARVFADPKISGGGNPVTVFLTSSPAAISDPALSPSVRSDLAKTCEWESVIVAQLPSSVEEEGAEADAADDDDDPSRRKDPVLRFYMPSGEEVPFCAHAAMGAAAVIARSRDASSYSSSTSVTFTTAADATPQSVTVSSSGEAELRMTAVPTEDDVSHLLSPLGELRDALGLRAEDVALPLSSSSPPCGRTFGLLPCYVNSSIARNKTLFHVPDVDRLHLAGNPPDAERFRDLCDTIDSTGVYLYSPIITEGEASGRGREGDEDAPCGGGGGANHVPSRDGDDDCYEVLRYECRQFPRYSGYPEDPATGIAAAALAASLRRRGFGRPLEGGAPPGVVADEARYRYEFSQGSVMRRNSRIGVRLEETEEGGEGEMRFFISGLVDISASEEIGLPSR